MVSIQSCNLPATGMASMDTWLVLLTACLIDPIPIYNYQQALRNESVHLSMHVAAIMVAVLSGGQGTRASQRYFSRVFSAERAHHPDSALQFVGFLDGFGSLDAWRMRGGILD